MKRAIVSYHRDDEGHWVAELDCGHGQHVRHVPPFIERPWVESESGRAARVGEHLDCVRCDRRELPDDYRPYKATAEFTDRTVPSGLRARHSTKPGIWAVIHVLAGQLRYRLHWPFEEEQILDAGAKGVILPGVEHDVEPLGPARFYVEFHRRAEPVTDP